MKLKQLKPKYFLLGGAALLLLGVLAVIIPNTVVCASSAKYIYDRNEISELADDFDCILVLGAGVYSDGTPTPMLNDRLVVACEAYEAGRSDRLIMSGDHLYDDYNEPKAMRNFAIEQGIDSKVIFLDHAGISTYDSVYRAIKLYGVEKILIVTQKYHLYRAIYLAQSLGAEAYGVSANLRSYMKQPIYTAREWAARAKDFVMAITKPEATYMGEKFDLSGDGDITN